MPSPLDGVRVLDFSRIVAGPFAGRMLTDLGADVVKIEPPDGDGTRFHGRNVANIPAFFNYQNAGKRNICIDLAAPGAIDLVKDLVRLADIVIENYRPGVMRRLGIDYPVLAEVNPKLIMLSISGYGQDGPESKKPSYAPVVHAELGLMHRLAERNESPPGDLPLSVGDTNASLHGLVGVLAALHMRAQTGIGQHIDMAMLDATFATDDRVHFELEDMPDTIVKGPIMKLEFGTVYIAADPEMRLVFKKLMRRGMIEDPTPPGADLATKIRARREAIDAVFARCETFDAFSELMDTLDLPWGEVRDPRTLRDQPTLAARNMLVDIDDRAGGTRPIANSPYRFSNASAGIRGPAAHRGEHNHDVLTDWLDLEPDDIARMQSTGLLKSENRESENDQ